MKLKTPNASGLFLVTIALGANLDETWYFVLL